MRRPNGCWLSKSLGSILEYWWVEHVTLPIACLITQGPGGSKHALFFAILDYQLRRWRTFKASRGQTTWDRTGAIWNGGTCGCQTVSRLALFQDSSKNLSIWGGYWITGTYTTLTHTPPPKIIRVVNLIVAYQIAIRSLNHKNGKIALFKPWIGFFMICYTNNKA